MTKNTIRTLSSLTALTVLLAATGCEHPEMALDDWADEDVAYRTPEFETADPLAAAEGKVYCGEEEEIYENSSGKSQCKTINVKNSCAGQSELAPWTLDKDGEQQFDEDDERYIDGNKTKAYDMTIEDGGGVYLECGSGELGECCTYTIESCNPPKRASFSRF